MSISDVEPGERVKDVHVGEDTLSVDLVDGRTIMVPLAWYPRLLHATPEQLANWRVSGGGFGVHWPDLDEDLSTKGLLCGVPAPGLRERLEAAEEDIREGRVLTHEEVVVETGKWFTE